MVPTDLRAVKVQIPLQWKTVFSRKILSNSAPEESKVKTFAQTDLACCFCWSLWKNGSGLTCQN